MQGIGQNQRRRVCFVHFARWRHRRASDNVVRWLSPGGGAGGEASASDCIFVCFSFSSVHLHCRLDDTQMASHLLNLLHFCPTRTPGVTPDKIKGQLKKWFCDSAGFFFMAVCYKFSELRLISLYRKSPYSFCCFVQSSDIEIFYIFFFTA